MKHLLLASAICASLMHRPDTGENATTGSATIEDIDEDGKPVGSSTESVAANGTHIGPVPFQHPRDRFPVVRTEGIELKTVVFDDELQSRVKLDPETVSEYAEIIKDRRKRKEDAGFPAVDIFEDPATGKRYMVGGFHRGYAHKDAKEKEILANIRFGTKQDALLFAATENTTHGLKRTQKDKQKALKIVLSHPDATSWSNVEIAKAAGVSEAMVRDHRTLTQSSTKRVVKKGDKVVEMDVSRIGSRGGKSDKKKPSKKTPKSPASPGKIPVAGDGSEPATDQKGRPTLGLNEAGEAAMKKIVKALGEQGAGFEEAVRTGTIALTNKDIVEMSETSPQRIARILPLVADKGMKPKQAYAFLDQEVGEKTTFEQMMNLALVGKTALTLPDVNKMKEKSTTGIHIKHGKFDLIVLVAK